ncbi:hypothetical protein CEUSTIGMA_g8016.t1 [Chlamydomonas eustigma]|uniref:AN1-type domain-containing protein n=1 Tax=Chlamydomonas eustigma TaxID=1157962 RepID=A0A250XCG6_9CHLO|nr:hypothetical protein CEUSTIGMA_g8016.t1 [Chlamydomonas eustigma]|eukprot:GAX80579.1 hypothetical protein CEUSTIGMA_g8016.t1 [Chlamydomonas eustigma]
MANSPDSDLMALGDHCTVTHCGQVDFLPFRCDCCLKTFCLEHRSYSAHACKESGSRQTEVIVCPICARGVKLVPGQDPNLVFDVHTRENCDPSHYAKVHKKARCPVPRCSEKLTLINAYRCKTCSVRVCLKHRHPDDHSCSEIKATTLASRALASSTVKPPVMPKDSVPTSHASALGLNKVGIDRGIGASNVARTQLPAYDAVQRPSSRASTMQAARSQYEFPENSVKGTAQRRMAQQQQQQQQQSGRSNDSNANPLVETPRPEECPQCLARFSTVQQLVQHVEEWHPSSSSQFATSNPQGTVQNPLTALTQSWSMLGATRGSTALTASRAADVYRCSFCQSQFNDPVQLVSHGEQCGARSTAAATAAGGSSKRGAIGNVCVVS